MDVLAGLQEIAWTSPSLHHSRELATHEILLIVLICLLVIGGLFVHVWFDAFSGILPIIRKLAKDASDGVSESNNSVAPSPIAAEQPTTLSFTGTVSSASPPAAGSTLAANEVVKVKDVGDFVRKRRPRIGVATVTEARSFVVRADSGKEILLELAQLDDLSNVDLKLGLSQREVQSSRLPRDVLGMLHSRGLGPIHGDPVLIERVATLRVGDRVAVRWRPTRDLATGSDATSTPSPTTIRPSATMRVTVIAESKR